MQLQRMVQRIYPLGATRLSTALPQRRAGVVCVRVLRAVRSVRQRGPRVSVLGLLAGWGVLLEDMGAAGGAKAREGVCGRQHISID